MARRAVAALDGKLFDKAGLDDIERAHLGKTLDRRDRTAFELDGGGQAGVDGFAVEQHRARAAFALRAAFLRTREVQVLAQDVEQAAVRLGLERDGLSVYNKIKQSWFSLTSARYLRMQSGSYGSTERFACSASFTAPHTAGATGT